MLLKKGRNKSDIDPPISVLGKYPKEMKSLSYPKEVSATPCSLHLYINQDRNDGILLGLEEKREILPFVTTWVNLEDIA